MRFIGKFTSDNIYINILYCCVLWQRSAMLRVKRVSFLAFFQIFLSLHANVFAAGPIAQADTLHNSDTVFIFTENILFPKSSAVVLPDFMGNSARIDSICSFLSRTDTQNLLSVKVIGSYSPEGKYIFNTNLAEARARALAGLVQEIDREISPVVSIKHPLRGQNAEYWQQRHAELQIACRNNADADNTVVADAGCRDENGMPADTMTTPPPTTTHTTFS